MFDLEQQIKTWRRESSLAGISHAEVLTELENHLRELTAQFSKAGLSEEEAFRRAVAQLGNSAALKQEFSKVQRQGFWFALGRSFPILVLSLWFVTDGLDCLHVFLLPLFSELWPIFRLGDLNWLRHWIAWWLFLEGSVLILIGMGLLRHRNGWRIAALVAVSCRLCLRLPFYIHDIISHHEKWFSHDAYPQTAFGYLGLRLPMVFIYIIPVIDFAIALWAIYFLTRSRTQRQFRSAAIT